MAFQLCVATFLHGDEFLTHDFYSFIVYLAHELGSSCQCVIYSDKEISLQRGCPQVLDNIVKAGTKYQRFQHLIKYTNADLILCLDNDVTCCHSTLLDFVREMLTTSYVAGWGRIEAVQMNGLVAQMVMIDKWLSHGVFRPLLWQLGVGISVPGQCFIIRKNAFIARLMPTDTFLDDLALGLCLRLSKSSIRQTSAVLGRERPNVSWVGLLQQRKRWAKGFSSIFTATHIPQARNYVLLHGLVYHGMWLPIWLVLFFAGQNFLLGGFLLLVALTCALTFGHLRLLPAALCYQLMFPILHVWWFTCVLFSIVARKNV